jgi:nitrite reductase/ring-hydroxylating ferredoxin subunit
MQKSPPSRAATYGLSRLVAQDPLDLNGTRGSTVLVMAEATVVRVGTVEELQAEAKLTVKVGALPVVVFWHEGQAWAIEDRCPHMGFPLHQGTVEAGLVTCHWHHARFDLATGCTLDLFADDARGFDIVIDGDDVFVRARSVTDPVAHLWRRLDDGLEEGLTLVVAKSVLGLLEAEVPPAEVVRRGVEFGTRYRGSGWGAGLTVLVAMANLLPVLAPEDRALALVHGLAFVARDTRNRPPRFPLHPFEGGGVAPSRLAGWYRRFVDTRSGDAAERVLATALATGTPLADVERTMLAAVTDHVFIDGGHTIDFTNKAFEALEHLGTDVAHQVLPTLVHQTASASRAEESGTWRHPHDLAELVNHTDARLADALVEGAARTGEFKDVAGLGWHLLEDDPSAVVDALLAAIAAGAAPEELGRALAFAAALRVARFHVQNDFGDWDTVHHAFTAANALHQALVRTPSPELHRGLVHGALRVYLDRFLNVPAARLSDAATGDLAELDECWEIQGGVDRAGAIAAGYLRGGGDPAELVAALGHALLHEDAEFHWYQVVEAGVRQFHAWPTGSEEGIVILSGLARFLAAHTPTRRELSRVVDIAARLRRGEELYEAS